MRQVLHSICTAGSAFPLGCPSVSLATPRALAYDGSMLFLIDGYNVTKGDPATERLSLEQQRDALVARLRVRGEQLLGRGRIVVVFDGDADVAPAAAYGRAATYPIAVAFSRGGKADDEIVRRAGAASGDRVCLVSSDRELADRVRARLGKRAEVRTRECAFESAVGVAPAQPSRPARSADEADLPRDAAAITAELERTWLGSEE
jgi:predicted RNA-binding protein with PIN domain